MHILKVKITNDCPNRDMVVEYYQNKANNVGYCGDSGLDLVVPNTIVVSPEGITKINLGIQCELVTRTYTGTKEGEHRDEGISYMLVPRSSISNTPLSMANSIGIIDKGFRGNVLGCVRNHQNEPYTVVQGTRLFQVVAFDGKPIQVEVVDRLSETDRQNNGFGSTNK